MGGGDAAAGKTKTKMRCELCGGAAAVHCAADSAFLCLRCDARVHGANFLASRHQRRRLGLGGAVPAESASSSSSSSSISSSCVSTADSAESTAATPAAVGSRRKQRAEAVLEGWAKRMGLASGSRRKQRAEAVLEDWAKRMGFASGAARRRAAAAARALRAHGRGVEAARVPLRVAMAAALWSEVSDSAAGCKRGVDAALLCRLEATAHVPARLVLTVASWMARTRPAAAHEEEEDQEEEEEG